jgi:4'-phosphopantetheinyl transferase
MNHALERLAAGEAHVYTAKLGDPLDPQLVQALLLDLTTGERDRFHRFVFDRDRGPYLVARSLVRRALSSYAAASPRSWVFEADARGKPRLAGPAGAPPLTFNVSHTRGLAACIVALDRAVGVDVEHVERASILDVVDHCLAPSEARRVFSVPPALQVRAFLEHWTLKEAYLKARGTGLSVPPELVSFEIGPASVQLRLDPRAGDGAGQWCFFRGAPSGVHLLAAAAELHQGSEPGFRIFDGALLLGGHSAGLPSTLDSCGQPHLEGAPLARHVRL